MTVANSISSAASSTNDEFAYDPLLRAFHQAFHQELCALVRDVPCGPRSHVLDVPCGDGFYLRCLVGRLGKEGRLVGADLSDMYLERAARLLSRQPKKVELVRADVYALPFEDNSFEVAWSAQSMISLDDPVAALREMGRVVKPGGHVAVLESDEYHHLLLPWPVGLELALQRAVGISSRQRYGQTAKLAPSRSLRKLLFEAGLRPLRKRTSAADRQAPFSRAVERFLRLHFRFLYDLVRDHLGRRTRLLLEHFIDPVDPDSFFNRPDAELTCLNTVHLAQKLSSA